jgi:hypothetical protein
MTVRSKAARERDAARRLRSLKAMEALAAHVYLSRLLQEHQPDYVPPLDLMQVCRRVGELLHQR